MFERELTRYAAYFRGWCQAFGEHEQVHGKTSGIEWLLADDQVGLVLPREFIKPLYREVLLHRRSPTLMLRKDGIEVGSLRIRLDRKDEQIPRQALADLATGRPGLHLYLTSHLIYGGGNRIITFSARKPLLIIYKQIGTMVLRLD